MRGTMRQNVQKTIPSHLQPPMKLGALFTSPKFRSPLLKFFFLLPPVPAPSLVDATAVQQLVRD